MNERALEKLKTSLVRLKRIEDHTPTSLQEYLASDILQDGLMKNLEDVIQNILDACALIIKERDLGIPGEDQGYVDLIKNAGLITEETSHKLHRFRGLRNRLVHAYGQIDEELVYENLSEKLDEFRDVVKSLKEIAGE